MRQLRHNSRVLRGWPAEKRRGRLRVVLPTTSAHIGADGDGRADAGAYDAGAHGVLRADADPCANTRADCADELLGTAHARRRAGVGSRIGHLPHRLPQHPGAMSPLRRRGHGAAHRCHGRVDVLGRDVSLLRLQHVNHSPALAHERGRHVRMLSKAASNSISVTVHLRSASSRRRP